jgi:hypothetical protein
MATSALGATMSALGDYRLQGDAHGPGGSPDGSRKAILWIVAAVVAVALGVTLWFIFRPRPQAAPELVAAPQPVSGTTQEVEAKPLENLPPLDGSDDLVRGLVKGLSSRPEFLAWLANENVVRSFVAIVENIASGQSPKTFLGEFAPKEPFRGAARGKEVTIDPRSFARYNTAADVFASLDSPGVARAYLQLSPLCESAYRELGVPGTFRETLERAFGRLLATPDAPENAPLVWNYATYQYKDERLESLPAAQKQLLRMGPRNVKIVKDKLQELAIAMRLVPKTPQP